MQASGNKAQGLKGCRRIQHKKIRGFAFLDAVSILDTQYLRRVGGDQIKHVIDLITTTHVTEVESQLCSCEHIALAQGEPGIHDGIVTKSNVDAPCQQLFDTRNAPSFGIGIKTALQDDIVKGIGNDVHLSTGEQANEFKGIGIIVGMHGGAVAGRYPSLPALLHRVGGHHFGKARERIIGLIAVAVNIAVELFGQGKGIMHIFNTHIARPLVVWNASNQVAAKFHSLAHQLVSIRERQDAILGKSNELQVTYILYLVTHLNQGPQRGQVRIAYIHVTANVQRSLGYFPTDLLQGTLFNIFTGQTSLAFTPDLDPFKQRARSIVARLPHRQHGIQMNVSINEGRRHEPASGIDLSLSAIRGKIAGDFSKAPILDGDVNKTTVTIKPGMADDEVILHMIFLFGTIQVSFLLDSSLPTAIRTKRDVPP